MLIMDGPRPLAHAGRNPDRAGSGGKRPANPKTKEEVPVVGGKLEAVRRAEAAWIFGPDVLAYRSGVRFSSISGHYVSCPLRANS